jgi:hypothetical protein
MGTIIAVGIHTSRDESHWPHVKRVVLSLLHASIERSKHVVKDTTTFG